jgi:hypothetical protein
MRDSRMHRQSHRRLVGNVDIHPAKRDKQLMDISIFKPVMRGFTQTDADAKLIELETIRIEHTRADKEWTHRMKNMKSNKIYVRSLILLSYVSKEMDQKLRNEADFNTVLEDPIELLKRIESFMKRTEDGKYDVWNLWETMKKWTNTQQAPGEGLYQFRERFERQTEIIMDQLGSDVF